MPQTGETPRKSVRRSMIMMAGGAICGLAGYALLRPVGPQPRTCRRRMWPSSSTAHSRIDYLVIQTLFSVDLQYATANSVRRFSTT